MKKKIKNKNKKPQQNTHTKTVIGQNYGRK